MGQALTQMPQAMHLEAVGLVSTLTKTPKGQASAQAPQPLHFSSSILMIFLSIIS